MAEKLGVAPTVADAPVKAQYLWEKDGKRISEEEEDDILNIGDGTTALFLGFSSTR